jgi:hypothetical protein
LQNEAAAPERDQQIERDRQAAEVEARAEAERKQAEAERQRSVEESAANSATGRAEHDRLAAAKDEIRLEQQAHEAEARAIAIDPQTASPQGCDPQAENSDGRRPAAGFGRRPASPIQ